MRQPKKRTQLSMNVPPEFKRRLAFYCLEHDLRIKQVVIEAINEYLDKHEEKKEH